MIAPVVVFAVGNPSRGDDAIGPACSARLEHWLAQEGLADRCELVEDFQLQIEHVLDLQGRQLALFVDAGARTPGPFTFQRIAPATGAAFTTHELSPEAVLQVYLQTEGEAPPPAFVLCIRGEEFGLGEPLSEAASQHLEAAFCLLAELCRQPTLAAWEQIAIPASA